MNINQQIQQLIEQAPLYGTEPEAIQQVAPVFQAIASRLQHSQYYVLQNLEHNWIMTTLKHRSQPEQTKNVVYAYPSLESVKASAATLDPQVVALPVPTVQILFQLLAMKPIDSIIFLDRPNEQQSGIEIARQALFQAIEQYAKPRYIPPDIA
jgi:hypothetical protein